MLWFVLLIPPLIMVPWLGYFLFQPGSSYSDLLISHFPNVVFLQQTILTWREIPLWSPTILSGYPFVADPLSGLWYLPNWLAVIFPSAAAFNFLFMLHLVWGGLGMYRFLRNLEISTSAAVFGGILFELFSKTWAHYAAGHVSLVCAVMWTPWLLLVENSSFRKSEQRRIFQPGLVWGIILLADVRWGALAGVVWMAFRIFLCKPYRLESYQNGWTDRARELAAQTSRFTILALPQLLIGLLIAAPLMLPLIQYTGLSTRSHLTPQEALSLSLPLDRLLGLIFPDPRGYAEWTLYPSAIGLALIVVATLMQNIRRRAGFWLGLLLVSLFLSLGSNIPFLEVLGRIPGFDLIRVPARWLFVCGLSGAMIGATALNEMDAVRDLTLGKPRIRPELVISGIAEFAILFSGLVWLINGAVSFNFLWGTFWSVLAAALIILRMRNLIPGHAMAIACILFGLVDLGIVNRLAFEPHPPAEVLGQAKGAADYLATQKGTFRVYSPSYSIPQQVAVLKNLSMADGIDPLQLDAYAEFMERASGVPGKGYSVTLPPFLNGDPALDNREYLPDPKLLGLLNVRYLAADFEIRQPDLHLAAQFGNTRIYENPYCLPRAWVQEKNSNLGVGAKPVEILPSGPNHFRALAKGPGLLVLAEIQYPGWKVWVDGVQQPAQTVRGLLRGVELGAGGHEVVFAFEPILVPIGLGCSLAAWVGILIWSLRWRRSG
ncbi:MAG TPA: hypothetical protein VMT46_13615 [Anaerolineaceae bacterium]|nr:hypothetical protein [Anaerolineaceae bacterium]